MNKTYTVQTSDNVWRVTDNSYYTSYHFSDISFPPGASINSVTTYVEHYEDRGFREGKLQWSVGTGWPSSPVTWGTTNTVPIRLQQINETLDSWDVTNFVDTPEKVNSMELQVKNNESGRVKKTRVDYIFTEVEYTPSSP